MKTAKLRVNLERFDSFVCSANRKYVQYFGPLESLGPWTLSTFVNTIFKLCGYIAPRKCHIHTTIPHGKVNGHSQLIATRQCVLSEFNKMTQKILIWYDFLHVRCNL